MRNLLVAGLACAFLVLPACGDSGDATSTTGGTGTTGDMTASGSTTSGGTDTSAPTTTEMCPDETETGGTGSVMEEFGAPCMEDADCVKVLGDGGVCLKDILGIYGLPGGYCSKYCMLPDLMTKYVENDATCGPGVTCIGAMGYFEGCVIECTDDSQCPREGYECRTMPQIGETCDPKFCLMTDDNML